MPQNDDTTPQNDGFDFFGLPRSLWSLAMTGYGSMQQLSDGKILNISDYSYFAQSGASGRHKEGRQRDNDLEILRFAQNDGSGDGDRSSRPFGTVNDIIGLRFLGLRLRMTRFFGLPRSLWSLAMTGYGSMQQLSDGKILNISDYSYFAQSGASGRHKEGRQRDNDLEILRFAQNDGSGDGDRSSRSLRSLRMTHRGFVRLLATVSP